ncbi:hypothetical protein [Bacillus horti]|uniref:Uncharacterized protein n=1 Tax=Caldalkalibacillus horti TaxID=77523 RepID=A0ABT9VX90_9BACI|nr:hypothetical protein [Bacillus horti]MDQ0165606.1 hypothetical protein [Bacillus horti]
MQESRNRYWLVPSSLQELFGKKISYIELYTTLIFSMFSTILLLLFTDFEWNTLAGWRNVLIIFVFIDITGGVVANFSSSTNSYYLGSSKARLVFIGLHIQPLILSWLINDYFLLCLVVWGYTIVAALIINFLSVYTSHRLIAGAISMFGVVLLLMFSEALPIWLTIFLLLYLVKVSFSFAVNHDLNKESNS